VNLNPTGLDRERVVCASPENRAMLMLLHLSCAPKFNAHEDNPGPVLVMPSGAEVVFTWDEWDRLQEWGFVAVTDEAVRVTHAGRTALNRWQRKYRVRIGE
jgi:hypothetical protein